MDLLLDQRVGNGFMLSQGQLELLEFGIIEDKPLQVFFRVAQFGQSSAGPLGNTSFIVGMMGTSSVFGRMDRVEAMVGSR